MTTLRLGTPIDDDEAQMRRALRLGSPGGSAAARDQGADPRAPRRFAQSGDVPVTRLAGRKDSASPAALIAAEEALQAESAGREQAEAALVQALATITTLQTKLAHAEIAHAEALEAERQKFETRLAAREVPAPQPAAPQPTAPQRQPRAQSDGANTAAGAGKEAPEGKEIEPVQWWVPGWQGTYRRRP